MSSKSKNTTSKKGRVPPSIDDETAVSLAGDGSDSLSPEPRPVTRQALPETERIGDILRRVREHRGEDLAEISDYLRIKAAYLFALEHSRYEELPADAYVIGFLRTYANYLGLDGRGAIDQYRREMAGARRKPQLSMPQPMPEGRAPTLAIIVAGVIAAILVYLVWYALSSPNPDKLVEKKPILPVVAEQTPLPTVTVSPEATTTDATALSTQTATSDGITLGVPAASTAMTPTNAALGAKATATAEPDTKTPPPVKEKMDSTEAPTSALPPAPHPAPATEPAKETPKTEIPAAAASPAEPVVDTPAKTEPTPPAAASFGEKSSKSHVVVKAEKDSWILVTDSKGNTVFDRTLKAGETYNVPVRKDLKLTTGNTSGVSFALDGQPLPKLKTNGKVARAVPLETTRLKNYLSGTTADTEDATETEE